MSRPTVQRYLTLLEQLFLLIRARAWSRNIGQRLIKAPKVWIPDTGLACHLLDYGQARFEEDETALAGSLFENFVAMELVKQAAWAETNVRIHHLRTAGGREVDIVMERGDGAVCGVEVKLGATVHSRDFGALRHLQSKLGQAVQDRHRNSHRLRDAAFRPRPLGVAGFSSMDARLDGSGAATRAVDLAM